MENLCMQQKSFHVAFHARLSTNLLAETWEKEILSLPIRTKVSRIKNIPEIQWMSDSTDQVTN